MENVTQTAYPSGDRYAVWDHAVDQLVGTYPTQAEADEVAGRASQQSKG